MLSYRRARNSGNAVMHCLVISLMFPACVQAADFSQLENMVFKAVPLSTVETTETDRKPVTDVVYDSFSRQALHNSGAIKSDGGSEPGISEYRDRIFRIEEENGPYAIELSEVLHSMGLLYQARSLHEEALTCFKREEHINRIHFGLFSDTQIPAVKAQIQSYISAGMAAEAGEKQQYLIYLLEKSYGNNDPRLLPALTAYARWNISRFNELVRYEMSGNLLLAFGNGIGTERDYRAQAFDNLEQAASLYSRAVSILVDNGHFDDPLLYQMEDRLVESIFIEANRDHVLEDPDNYLQMNNLKQEMMSFGEFSRFIRDAFKFGKDSYNRQLAYIRHDPNGKLGRYINTLLALGDWYVLFGKNNTGYQKYEEAHALLKSMKIPAHTIREVLSPEVPVSLPTFTAKPHTEESAVAKTLALNPYRGYIDVSFRINRNGSARDVKVLGSSGETDHAVERCLLSLIRQSLYRPRFAGEHPALDDDVALRYYYSY